MCPEGEMDAILSENQGTTHSFQQSCLLPNFTDATVRTSCTVENGSVSVSCEMEIDCGGSRESVESNMELSSLREPPQVARGFHYFPMKGAGLIRVIKGRNGYLVPGGGYIDSREEDRVIDAVHKLVAI